MRVGSRGKPSMIKYHQLLSKVTSIDGKSRFDQLATANYGLAINLSLTVDDNNCPQACDLVRR